MQPSKSKPVQLPLKGMFADFGKTPSGTELKIEYMGGNRYRIHTTPKKR